MGKLVLYLPDGTMRDIFLAKERLTIGRRADNDVALPYPAVSAEHAAVVTVLDDSFLEDLGSTNGTFVNDKSVKKHFLRDGDRVDIGREILVYLNDDEAQPDPLPAELLHHERGTILEPLNAQLEALADLAKARAARAAHETGPRPVVAEFDPQSRQPMTGHVATEFDALDEGDDTSERTRPVRAVSGQVGAASEAQAAPAVPPAPVDTVLLVRVLDGPNAGREVAFDKPELVLGRVGVQVAALKRTGNAVRLVAVEGAFPPRRNGEAVEGGGAALHPGDMFEVAGVTLSLVGVQKAE